jgi:hypothetical protein
MTEILDFCWVNGLSFRFDCSIFRLLSHPFSAERPNAGNERFIRKAESGVCDGRFSVFEARYLGVPHAIDSCWSHGRTQRGCKPPGWSRSMRWGDRGQVIQVRQSGGSELPQKPATPQNHSKPLILAPDACGSPLLLRARREAIMAVANVHSHMFCVLRG